MALKGAFSRTRWCDAAAGVGWALNVVLNVLLRGEETGPAGNLRALQTDTQESYYRREGRHTGHRERPRIGNAQGTETQGAVRAGGSRCHRPDSFPSHCSQSYRSAASRRQGARLGSGAAHYWLATLFARTLRSSSFRLVPPSDQT